MKNTFNRLAVKTALFLMVLYLTYVNSKSLLYLVAEIEQGTIDKVFAIIGALAFSSVTVIIMRRGRQKWLKFVFPLFDTVLVFCGFNLKYADNLTGNWIALILTIFLALFSGLITYSLGTISYTDSNEIELDKIKSENQKLTNEAKVRESELKNYQSEFEKMQSKLEEKTKEAEKYRMGYLAAERSRILKKAEKNRTTEELRILEISTIN